MALINEEPGFVCSSSVQAMRNDLGDELVTAVDLTGYLLGKHPEYAQGLAETMILARQAGAEMRSVDDWLSDVSVLYEDEERPLDGRLVLLGLALMIPELERALRRDDFLLILMAEYKPDYDSLLSPAGKELFYSRFGRPRMEGPPPQGAKGIDSPGAPGGSSSEASMDLKEIFEGFESMPQMAAPVETEEVAAAEDTGADDVFESMEPAREAGEPADRDDKPAEEADEFAEEAVEAAGEDVFESIGEPRPPEAAAEDGAKGIDRESLLKETGAEESALRQARRLEAAMPASVQVQQTTELLVMLPRAGSEGLRAFLPKETAAGEIIEKDDVEERGAELVFEAADKPLTVYFAVEAAQKDFEIEEPVKRVKIHADSDGDYEVFYLTPLRATNRAPVQVRLFKDEALSDVVSTIRLFAKIEPPELGEGVDPQLATLWRAAAYAAVPLNLNVSGDYISVGAISGSEGVAIGGGTSAVVTRTSANMAAGNITQLFTPLLRAVFGGAPLDQINPAIENVQALQVEVEKGPGASDPQIATLLQIIIEMVPEAAKAVLELFDHPEVRMAAGDVTRFVLGRIEQQ